MLDRALAQFDPRQIMLAAFLLALALVAIGWSWRIVKYLITLAHEGGHALVGLLCGRRLQGIRLHHDGSGLTNTLGSRRGIGLALTSFGGYPAPALAGLGGAALLRSGRQPLAILLIALVATVAMSLLVRNLMGLLIVIATSAAGAGLIWGVGPVAQRFAADLIVWLLLLGSLRDVAGLARVRRGSGSDAEALAIRSHLPVFVWVLCFGAACVACTALAAKWLLDGSLR